MLCIASPPPYKSVRDRGIKINIGHRPGLMFGGHVSLKWSVSCPSKLYLFFFIPMYFCKLLFVPILCFKLNYMLLFFAGSKEETFFDSQAWLESDCEDDFYSVNGGKNTSALSHFCLACISHRKKVP